MLKLDTLLLVLTCLYIGVKTNHYCFYDNNKAKITLYLLSGEGRGSTTSHTVFQQSRRNGQFY